MIDIHHHHHQCDTASSSSDSSTTTVDPLPGCLKTTRTTTRLSSSSTDNHCHCRKNVSFDSIEILEFPIELGDNPAVHAGPPIQLGWRPHLTSILELDIYEVFRHKRRDRQALGISVMERIETLLSQGYTEQDIIDATLECHKVQKERFLSASTASTATEE